MKYEIKLLISVGKPSKFGKKLKFLGFSVFQTIHFKQHCVRVPLIRKILSTMFDFHNRL